MPAKRTADRFPLWRHPGGQWCKKHKSKPYYFGTNKEAALKRFVAEWDLIRAGLPRPKPLDDPPDALTIKQLVNAFLTAKRERVEVGELAPGTWDSYFKVCRKVADILGKTRLVVSLQPADFGRLRAAFARTLGPNSLDTYLTMCRVLFKFGSGLTDRPARFGDQFDGPPARLKRLHRQAKPVRLLAADQLRSLVAAADPVLRAQILLGLNCGFGATDCAELTQPALDARPGWVVLPRRKTGVGRRCPLWPETIAAIEAAWLARPRPVDPVDAGRLFLSPTGLRPVRFQLGGPDRAGARTDSINVTWSKLCVRAGVKVKGAGFYLLRHVFLTRADEARDQPAVNVIMGHADEGMAAHYREEVKDERLQAVVDHMRAWLWPPPTPARTRQRSRNDS